MTAAAPALLNMDDVIVVPQCALRIPGDLALRRLMLPFLARDGHMLVACADPSDEGTLRTIERLAGMPLLPEIADEDSLRRAINRTYGKAARRSNAAAAAPAASAAPGSEDFVRIAEDLLNTAVLRQASDIHFEPEPDNVHVRLRVHGHLETLQHISHAQYGGVLGRLKVLARMDIAEKRLPQDGQITHVSENTGRSFSIRAATIPSRHGEKTTLRFLGLHASSVTLPDLGMLPHDHQLFVQAISRAHGLALITGPTGSGKTSTMYAALRHIKATSTKSIITIEDPVECDLPGVTQVDVEGERLTYGHALRSVLRHDPDVILIGEIRDAESANIAVRAALTGHLVLSTLHTHSAASAITRLRDLGVEPYLIAATLHFTAAQRLVRRLCRYCRQPAALDAESAHALRDPGAEGRTVYEARGCKYCAGMGHISRFALFEMLPLNPALVSQIMEDPSDAAIASTMRHHGVASILDDAWQKLNHGETTVTEVVRTLAGA